MDFPAQLSAGIATLDPAALYTAGRLALAHGDIEQGRPLIDQALSLGVVNAHIDLALLQIGGAQVEGPEPAERLLHAATQGVLVGFGLRAAWQLTQDQATAEASLLDAARRGDGLTLRAIAARCAENDDVDIAEGAMQTLDVLARLGDAIAADVLDLVDPDDEDSIDIDDLADLVQTTPEVPEQDVLVQMIAAALLPEELVEIEDDLDVVALEDALAPPDFVLMNALVDERHSQEPWQRTDALQAVAFGPHQFDLNVYLLERRMADWFGFDLRHASALAVWSGAHSIEFAQIAGGPTADDTLWLLINLTEDGAPIKVADEDGVELACDPGELVLFREPARLQSWRLEAGGDQPLRVALLRVGNAPRRLF